ncbi:BTAD domain-containing putative transcriptional regulator [Nonomuraea sp. MCN248]|uniref:BTAD domain-containing putative transcriptional regulator n=1 Tax=Nonomuraea corallina TaxID=2989783 RepID=A0ABT4SL68_9ACTN|nr:BTAD domain-containing putative transcriptional regulator [Nonomuraea corallina]MDA0637864.1 BTAD domain-containing putative transcriptional regulator [Nonomuraea corallina]
MRFEILGPTAVRGADGAAIPIGGPRVRALLALLALEPGRVIDADRLATGLYGEDPPEGVANALQSQVSRLRRALGRDRVEFHPAGYRLVADPMDVDAIRFERLAAEGRRALGSGDARRAAALLREGLALWRGRPLADAPHAGAAAARLSELRLTAVEDRTQADLELGRHREVVAELRQLVADHPLRERPRAQLMRALYGSGRQAEALAAYAEGRRVLGDELGIEPGPELTAAHLAVLRADPALGPAAPPIPDHASRTVDGATGGPVSGTPGGSAVGGAGRGGREGVKLGTRAQLTSFVGRGEELRQVSAELAASRLVTLVGPGGAGKTRLALEVAERAEGDVCLVQLAPLTAEGEVTPAVLTALGIRDRHRPEPPQLEPVERLVAALAGRDLLLILDNSEHVVEAVARLTDTLLGSCPGLRVLATSREGLGITGESLVPVAPLRLPPPDAPDPLDYPAVRLFADRAAAVRAGFTVTPDNAEQVIRICHAMDGLPLAIELAAARLRTLSVAEVAARLDDRFRLLARGSRTALPRHQTLRAVVAWSWDLLDGDEQRMAGRLTVFTGGATAEAAERVCGLPEELLFSLAEKSLVEAVDGRFRMLETIRAFCAERLEEAGEAEAVREAHAAYYLNLAVEADGHLRRAEQLEWLARLDAESDDLNAAVRWTTESGRLEAALRLVGFCACYWWMRGHRTVSSALGRELLDRVGETPPAGLEEEYAMCVLVAAWNGVNGAWLNERLEALRPSRTTDYMPARLEFLTLLLSMFTGPPPDVSTVADLRELTATMNMSPWSTALTGCGYGFLLQFGGRPGSALAEFERSLAAFRAMGERWGTMLALSALADLAGDQGDHATALVRAEEALEVARELGAPADVAEGLCRRADALARTGELERARVTYETAADLSRRIGSTDMLARAHCGLGEVALAVGDAAGARTWLELAREECPTAWYSVSELRDRITAGLTAAAEAVSGR